MAGGLGATGPPASGAGGTCATAYALYMPNGRARSDPRFYLTAQPEGRVEIPTLFEESGVVEVLEEPPTLRPPTLGWDLWTLDTPRHVAGKKAFVENGYRKRLALFTGGTLTFVASCVEFLGWPRKPYQFLRDPALNAVGLTELVLNFGLTVATVREFMEPAPERFTLRSGFRGLELADRARVYLEREGQVAPAASHDFPPHTVEWGDDFAERAAYELVVQAHEWFGVEAGAVPFVDRERRRLDTAALDAHLKGSSLPALAAG
jgi:hypothetical protein